MSTPALSASPFLKDRADDDVAWLAWSCDVQKLAAAQSKPLLLFLGYHGCPWTRAMARSCFRRADVAALVAEHFFPIAIDSHLHPAINLAYQSSAQALGLEGGYPLLLFAMPDGMPVWATPYATPEPKDGQPGLLNILGHLITAFAQKPEEVAANAEIVRTHVSERLGQSHAGSFDLPLLDTLAPTFMMRMDLEHGGITGAPKFPNTPYFETLWRAHLRTGKAGYGAAVQLTYTAQCQSALYDHIGAGFFRYSMDGRWRTPDLEKTLYDNALILKGLCHLHGYDPNPLYAARIGDTADFICRELQLETGHYACGLASPDDEDAYKLSAADVEARLNAPFTSSDSAAFSAAYALGDGSMPYRQDPPTNPDPKEELRLMAIAVELSRGRADQSAALRNPLSITRWSMLAVTALCHAAKLLQQERYITSASACFNVLLPSIEAAESLPAAVFEEEAGPLATLDDMAAAGIAAIALASATGEAGYLLYAQSLGDTLLDRFTHDSGAFKATQEDTPFGPIIAVMDQPVPSGNAMAIRFLNQLSRMISAPRYKDASLKAASALSGEINNNFMGLGSLLAALEDLYDPIDVAWTAGDYDSETIAWAIAPPGALIVPPHLQAQHVAKPIQEAVLSQGIILCRKDEESAAFSTRQEAIDGLRHARRVAPQVANDTVL